MLLALVLTTASSVSSKQQAKKPRGEFHQSFEAAWQTAYELSIEQGNFDFRFDGLITNTLDKNHDSVIKISDPGSEITGLLSKAHAFYYDHGKPNDLSSTFTFLFPNKITTDP